MSNLAFALNESNETTSEGRRLAVVRDRAEVVKKRRRRGRRRYGF